MSKPLYAILPLLALVPAAVLVPFGSRGVDLHATAGDGLDQEELEALTEQIARDIERMRGVEFEEEVRVSIASREDFLKYAFARMERTTTEEELQAEEAVAKLLGLIPPEMDLLSTTMEVLEEQVGGFYDPGTRSFCLMEGFGGEIAKVILAHELTHALDDQLYDIDASLDAREGNADATAAYHAVVEGSGTALMNQWVMESLQERRISPKDLQDVPGLQTEAMAKAPEYIWKPLLCVYMRGNSFLVREQSLMKAQMKVPAAEDIRRAFATPPRSTEQVLHPEKYWDPDQRDDPRELGFHTDLPPGWRVEAEDTLGELGLTLFSTLPEDRKGIDVSNPMSIVLVKYTNAAATGWGGDRYLLLERDGARVVRLVTRWDSAGDADEFFASAEALQPHLAEANLRHCLQVDAFGSGCRSGARVRRSATDEVLVTSWIGVTADEVDALLEGVGWSEGL